MRRIRVGLPLTVLFVASVACGGKVSSTFDPSATPVPPSSAPGAAAAASTSLDTAAVARAQATCALPHGPVDPKLGLDALAAKLVGVWLSCDAGGSQSWRPPLNKAPAFELLPDGHMYRMAANPSNGLDRLLGADNEYKWSLEEEGADSEAPGVTYLDLSSIFGVGAWGDAPAFESDPVRLVFSDSSAFVPVQP